MEWMSEKEIYARELSEAVLEFSAEHYVWGEELFDKKIVIYPGKLKEDRKASCRERV